MTTYDEIYNRCARYLTDFELAEISQEDADAMFHEWMVGAISKFRKCKNDLSDRDDELRTFNIDLLDVEKEILAVMMAREWLAPQLNSALITKQVFGGKEEKLKCIHTWFATYGNVVVYSLEYAGIPLEM